MSKCFSLVVLSLFIISLTLPGGFCQEDQGPPAPPVGIELTLENSPTYKGVAVISAKITPLSECEIEAFILVPTGSKAVPDKEKYQVQIFNPGEMLNPMQYKEYTQKIPFYFGPIQANQVNEFTFQIFLESENPINVVGVVKNLQTNGKVENYVLVEGANK